MVAKTLSIVTSTTANENSTRKPGERSFDAVAAFGLGRFSLFNGSVIARKITVSGGPRFDKDAIRSRPRRSSVFGSHALLIYPTGKSMRTAPNRLSSPSRKNILIFRSRKSVYIHGHPVPQEGRFAVVTDVGCGMRWTRQCHTTNDMAADGEAVWS